MVIRWPLSVALLLCSSLCAPSSRASLGGTAVSVESDRKILNGRVAVLAGPGYSIHEIAEDGRKVREYIRPDGKVFAVAWRGASAPDLALLLGEYYREYENAASHTGRGNRVVRSANMVMERSGHMRDVRGKAYVPDLLPPDFRPEEIR